MLRIVSRQKRSAGSGFPKHLEYAQNYLQILQQLQVSRGLPIFSLLSWFPDVSG
jgi:hypothetical protein